MASDRERREPPDRLDARASGTPAAISTPPPIGEPGLAEPVAPAAARSRHRSARRCAKHADDQADRGEAQPEAQMQVGADIGEHAPAAARLRGTPRASRCAPTGSQHDLRSRRRSRASVLRRVRPARVTRIGRRARRSAPTAASANIAPSTKNTLRQPKQSPSTPPAAWPNNWPENLPGQEAAEHLLALLVGHHVADIGHARAG